MNDLHRFVRVDFERSKAFTKFSLHLRRFNILVGPNNCGKSTILTAFRILAAAMRKATSRKPEVVTGPNGDSRGHYFDLKAISVAEENIYYNYDDSHAASVRFRLSNENSLLLFFPPEAKRCSLIAESSKRCDSPSTFSSQFNCPIGFVPILGPVEHDEQLFEKEAARLALFNYQAARNFRNIWHHYPERFDEFRETLVRTWPGMDIHRPEPTYLPKKSLLHMFCPEERIPREIFWAGFVFKFGARC